MISIENGILQTNDRSFNGLIRIDASDGDADSNRLFDLLVELFEKATKGAVVIDLPQS